MNAQLGLERLSAVWWGFWGLLGAVATIGAPFTEASDKWQISGLGAGVLVTTLIAHKITCWVLAGFFSSRSQ